MYYINGHKKIPFRGLCSIIVFVVSLIKVTRIPLTTTKTASIPITITAFLAKISCVNMITVTVLNLARWFKLAAFWAFL